MWYIKEIYELEQEENIEWTNSEMVRVILESDYYQQSEVEVTKAWMEFQEPVEGDEWPDDMFEVWGGNANLQSMWMNNYMDALDELEE